MPRIAQVENAVTGTTMLTIGLCILCCPCIIGGLFYYCCIKKKEPLATKTPPAQPMGPPTTAQLAQPVMAVGQPVAQPAMAVAMGQPAVPMAAQPVMAQPMMGQPVMGQQPMMGGGYQRFMVQTNNPQLMPLNGMYSLRPGAFSPGIAYQSGQPNGPTLLHEPRESGLPATHMVPSTTHPDAHARAPAGWGGPWTLPVTDGESRWRSSHGFVA